MRKVHYDALPKLDSSSASHWTLEQAMQNRPLRGELVFLSPTIVARFVGCTPDKRLWLCFMDCETEEDGYGLQIHNKRLWTTDVKVQDWEAMQQNFDALYSN